MNTTHLKYFLATIEYGSINQAAKALFLSHSSIIYALNELENEIGGELVIRHKSGITLTELGKQVAEDAQTILNLTESWNAKSMAQDTGINIYAAPCIYYSFLNDIVLRLVSTMPSLRISSYISTDHNRSFLSEKPTNDLLKASVQIAGSSSNELNIESYFIKKHSLCKIPLFKSRYMLYLDKQNPLLKKEHISTSEIKELSIFASSHPSLKKTPFFSLFDPDKIFYLPLQPQIFEMIAKSGGGTILPAHLYSFPSLVNRNKIAIIPIDDFPVYYYASLYYRTEAAKKTVIQKVIDFIATYPFTEVEGAKAYE